MDNIRKTAGEMLCPARQIILKLKELGSLPQSVVVDNVFCSGGTGDHNGAVYIIVQIMLAHKELVWHKHCRSLVSTLRVQQATT